MPTTVTSTITAVLVALLAEIDVDVTERRDLGLRTPNELTPVYKARRINSVCSTRNNFTKRGERGPSEAQVCRWATPFLRVGTTQFVAWADSVLRFSLPVQGFVRSRSTDMLQASRRPQKMMPCSGTSVVATVYLSIS